MARTEPPRVAVIGAGPVGLEAALYARTLNWPVSVFERGRAGEHLRQWGHVRLFTPFGMNSTPLGRALLRTPPTAVELPADAEVLTGREHVARYLEPLAASPVLREAVRPKTHVLHVGRRGCFREDPPGDARRACPFRLLVREGPHERVEEADVVLDCSGTYGQHRWLGDGGIPAVGELAAEKWIAYGLDDVAGDRRPAYAGKSVLVVGAGTSAATTVCGLAGLAADHIETWVTWLARGTSQPIKRFTPDPFRERDRLAVRANTLATRDDGNVEFFAGSVVEQIVGHGQDKGFTVTARVAGKPRSWEVERVVATIGYQPDLGICRELHVQEPAGDPRTGEPNYFTLGAKSQGRGASFLLRTGFDQVRAVFAQIAGKPDLDLYRKK